MGSVAILRTSMSTNSQSAGVNKTPLPPINFRVEVPDGQLPWKSIGSLEWQAVPGFAVLTGPNGAGKTQLLELLAYKLSGTIHPQLPHLGHVRVLVEGDTFGPGDVAYLPSRWEMTASASLGVAQMQSAREQLWNELQPHNVQHDIRRRNLKSRIERLLGIESIHSITQQEFTRQLPDDFSFLLEETDVVAGLAHVFVAYRLRAAVLREQDAGKDEIVQELGKAPWDLLNEVFAVAEFPYSVVSPVGTKLLDMYSFELQHRRTDQRISPGDLSSGEKMLMGLVFWLYSSQHHGRFPKLLLLDEPDAHLHPSMTRHFLNVIKEVLVDRYGVRTIISTHSPSTVALSPESSLFEMSSVAPRVSSAPSKEHSIGLLTAGLVVVSPSSRFVLVEDEADVIFYDAIRDILTDYGPSKDRCALPPSPNLVFLPASRGRGQTKTGGGSTVVSGWVEKFDAPPLSELIRGVIDRDAGSTGSARVQTLGRYSIENYWLDPLVVFALLVEENRAPVLPEIQISQGDQHQLRSMSSTQLQAIVDNVCGSMKAVLTDLKPEELLTKEVHLTNGLSLRYPIWMLERRGHDLLPLFQRVFGGPSVIKPDRLVKAIRVCRLIPKELAQVLANIQRDVTP